VKTTPPKKKASEKICPHVTGEKKVPRQKNAALTDKTIRQKEERLAEQSNRKRGDQPERNFCKDGK